MAETYREVPLGDDILNTALRSVRSLPVLENSHRKLQPNIVGCIGEVVFERFLERHGIAFEVRRESTRHDYAFPRGQDLGSQDEGPERSSQNRL